MLPIDEVSTSAESLDTSSPESSPSSKRNHRSDGFEIFIGRMPLTTTKVGLKQLAASFNPIHVRVLPKRDYTHLCGFVVFAELEQASGFLNAFNGVPALGGEEGLNVRFADGKKARKKVFIGGLCQSTGIEELRKLVEPHGTVLSINVIAQDRSAPCGFVTFAKIEEAAACIAALHGTPNADGQKKYVCRLGKTCAGSQKKQKKSSRKKRSSDNDSESGTESTKKQKSMSDDDPTSTVNSMANEIQNSWCSGNGCSDMQRENLAFQNENIMANNMGVMQQFPVFNATNQSFISNPFDTMGMVNNMNNQMVTNPIVGNAMFVPVNNMSMPTVETQMQMPMHVPVQMQMQMQQMPFQNDIQSAFFNNIPLISNGALMQPVQNTDVTLTMGLQDMIHMHQFADGHIDMTSQMQPVFVNN